MTLNIQVLFDTFIALIQFAFPISLALILVEKLVNFMQSLIFGKGVRL